MRKSILLSLLIITLVCGLVGNGLFATFSDTEKSTGNEFKAGTIDLAIEPEGGGEENPLTSTLVRLNNIQPGEGREVSAFLRNVGSLPGDCYLNISDIVNDGGVFTEPEEGVDPLQIINNIEDWVSFGLKFNNIVIIDPTEHNKLGDIESYWIYLGRLGSGEMLPLELSFYFQTDANNRYQGDECTFTIEFLLQQEDVPPLGPQWPPEDKWTFMVYIDADNDLEAAGIDDINEMELAGSTDEVNIVALMDRIPEYDSSNGDWTDAKIFYITEDTDPSNIASTVVRELGEVNMGDPNTLVNFVNWTIAKYPAKHYALVLWDYGDGWKIEPNFDVPPPFPPRIPLCFDMTSGDCLEIPELGETLADIGEVFDIVGFDACLMATAEVDYQVKDYARIRVGSEEFELPDGWPYDWILGSLTAFPTMTPRDLAAEIVNDYVVSYGYLDGVTMSAVELSDGNSATLAKVVDDFAQAMIDAEEWDKVTSARWEVECFLGDNDYIDLYHFAELAKSNFSDTNVKNKAQKVINIIEAITVAEEHGNTEYLGIPPHLDAHGISIYFPVEDAYLPHYNGYLNFTVDTKWDDFLEAYYKAT